MSSYSHKSKENKCQAVAASATKQVDGKEATAKFVDNRPHSLTQRKLASSINNHQEVSQFKPDQNVAKSQPAHNRTGLPDGLKSGIEKLSGYSLDDVKVHYNSAQPAPVQAHAYAQGTDIHLAPGQEKHLPHEAWHVVQQKQGRVKPTLQMKGKVNINDDAGLEKEADMMGGEALNNDHEKKIGPDKLLLANGSSSVQRKVVSLVKGSANVHGWKFLSSDHTHDYYDDGLPEPEVAMLNDTRSRVNEMDFDSMSDIEESDTELDVKTKGPHKIYRVNNLRDSAKFVHQVLKKEPDSTFGARMGGQTVFRFTGAGSQFKVQTTTKNALEQKDGTQGTGFMPDRESTDPQATGLQASYEHVFTELRGHTAKSIAQAMTDKFFGSTPYPHGFSARAQAKMDEAYALLTIAEPYRSDYAFAIFVASIQALLNGATSIQEAYYAGKGQIDALHAGASSYSRAGVSGQLMEQNLGLGINAPHPTQTSMNLSAMEWKGGLKRTVDLFDRASKGTDHSSMLAMHMLKPMGMGTAVTRTDISAYVTIKRAPGNWGDAVVKVAGIVLAEGQKIIYEGIDYIVKGITPTGFITLKLG